jgi:hypothetical protein
MTRFDGVPGWPPLAGVVGLAAAYVASLVVLVVVAATAEAVGYEPDNLPPGAVLLVAMLFAATSIGVCLVVARQTARPAPGQFGLCRVPLREAALLAVAAAAVLAAVVAAWAWATVERPALPVPAELDDRAAFEQVTGTGGAGDVDFGAGLVASALARAVIAPVAGQIVLLGFVLPALSRWRGPVPAALLCVIGLAALAGVVGDGGRLALPALTLAGLLVALRLVSGSLLPGIALGCGAAGVALGVAVRWEPAGVAVLGVTCAAAGLALVLAAAPREAH